MHLSFSLLIVSMQVNCSEASTLSSIRRESNAVGLRNVTQRQTCFSYLECLARCHDQFERVKLLFI